MKLTSLVGAVLLALCSPALAQYPVPQDAFLEKASELADWIDENSDFGPMEDKHPAYLFLPTELLHYIVFQNTDVGYIGQTNEIMAVYSSGIMYLPTDFDVEDVNDQSTLLHELVHHLQELEGREYRCAGELEKVAYDLADAWLAERGLGPQLEPLTYLIYTSCPRDGWY